jgi:tRNA pseudouridine38-40 synthase
MRTLKITLAYDGTHFCGWQTQVGRRTVQETLNATLQQITGEPVKTLAAGRTDAGVHALAQVVGVRTSSRLSTTVLLRALNAELPEDIVILSVEEAPRGFHPLRQARRKRYRYVIHDGPLPDVFQRLYSWKVWERLDAQAMHQAAKPLRGTHDFCSFQTSGSSRKTTIRTVYELSVHRQAPAQPDLVVVEIEANGFLYNMVRAIVGTLVEVGRGAKPESWPGEVLAARNRQAAGRTAPPEGLFLVHVEFAEPAEAGPAPRGDGGPNA